MFVEERKNSLFDWSMLGNIDEGRPNLGRLTHVAVYRLMQFSLRDTLISEVGVKKADEIFYKAGETAGKQFYKNVITQKNNFNSFIADLQESLKKLQIGILKIEYSDLDKHQFTLTVAEDLDCSGLPVTHEQICTFDEGFIKGILTEHLSIDFIVKEVDCWCSGERVCRFKAYPKN